MDHSYKGSKSTKDGHTGTTDSHYERRSGKSEGHKNNGSERGGIKGSKKGIKHSFAGRHLHETEHADRMQNTTEQEIGGFQNGNGATEL